MSLYEYRWEFTCSQTGAEAERIKEKSIPYQLQRLYLKMQTSNKRSIETSDVIKSFGWDSSEGKHISNLQYISFILAANIKLNT